MGNSLTINSERPGEGSGFFASGPHLPSRFPVDAQGLHRRQTSGLAWYNSLVGRAQLGEQVFSRG